MMSDSKRSKSPARKISSEEGYLKRLEAQAREMRRKRVAAAKIKRPATKEDLQEAQAKIIVQNLQALPAEFWEQQEQKINPVILALQRQFKNMLYQHSRAHFPYIEKLNVLRKQFRSIEESRSAELSTDMQNLLDIFHLSDEKLVTKLGKFVIEQQKKFREQEKKVQIEKGKQQKLFDKDQEIAANTIVKTLNKIIHDANFWLDLAGAKNSYQDLRAAMQGILQTVVIGNAYSNIDIVHMVKRAIEIEVNRLEDREFYVFDQPRHAFPATLMRIFCGTEDLFRSQNELDDLEVEYAKYMWAQAVLNILQSIVANQDFFARVIAAASPQQESDVQFIGSLKTILIQQDLTPSVKMEYLYRELQGSTIFKAAFASPALTELRKILLVSERDRGDTLDKLQAFIKKHKIIQIVDPERHSVSEQNEDYQKLRKRF